MLLMSTFDIVICSIFGVSLLTTIVVGILTVIKNRKVSNKDPKKGGK